MKARVQPKLALIVAAILAPCALAPAPVGAQPMTSKQASAKIPARYSRAVEFLQLLKQAQSSKSAMVLFDESKRPFRDIPKLLGFVSARGVTLVDVNTQNGKPLFVPRARLKRELARQSSRAFDAFAYLGYISAMPYSQYSELSCKPTAAGVVIMVAGSHALTFVRERGVLKLNRLEYLRLEGD